MSYDVVTQNQFLGEEYIWEIIEFKGKIYGGTYPEARLFEWNGSDAWVLAANGYPGQNDIYCLEVFNNKLYGGTCHGGLLLEWDENNRTWICVANMLNFQERIRSLRVYKGHLYGGTGSEARLFRWNGVDAWEQVADRLNGQDIIASLIVYNDRLYGGTYNPADGGRLFRWNDVDAWEQVAPRYHSSQNHIHDLAVYKGRLYGSSIGSSGAEGRLFRWNDVDAWEQVAPGYGGNTTIGGLLSGAYLYAMTAYNGHVLRWNDVDNWVELANTSEQGIWKSIIYNNYVYVGTSNNALLLRLGKGLITKAEFKGDFLSGNSPLTVTFTNLSTGDIVSWLWDFGDGNTSIDQNPIHVYLPGIYDVSLTITDAIGNRTTEVKTEYINAGDMSITITPRSGRAPLRVQARVG